MKKILIHIFMLILLVLSINAVSTLNVNLPSEYNSYSNFNFNNYINYSDTNYNMTKVYVENNVLNLSIIDYQIKNYSETYINIGGSYWEAFNFTKSVNGYYNTITLDIKKTGILTGNFTISIRNFLNGSDLCSYTNTSNSFSTSKTKYNFTLNNCPLMYANTNYYIILRNPSSDYMQVYASTNLGSGSYHLTSSNSGSTWTLGNQTPYFEIFYKNPLYNFSSNGNKSINISVLNTTGDITNSSLNNILLVNPYQYVYFINSSSDPITNFLINGTNYLNYFNTTIYPLGLGSHNYLFEKLGYNSTEFSLNFNSTSATNTTLSVPGAKVQISIRNLEDFSIISGSTSTIQLIGSSFSNTYTTSTGYFNISSLTMAEETYTVIISNPNYESIATAFNYNNQEIITLNTYMTPITTNISTIADLIIRVFDDYQLPLEDIDIYQYVWDSSQSAYVQSNLRSTDYNGETSFSVFLNTKSYNFCADYRGTLYCKNDQIINVNTNSLSIQIPTSTLIDTNTSNIYDINLSWSLQNTTIGNYSSITFNYNNPNQNADSYWLKVYEIANLQRTLVYSNYSNSHSGGLNVLVNLNTTNSYIAIASLVDNNKTRELDSLFLLVSNNIVDELENYGWIKMFIIVFIAIVIAAALNKYTHNVYIAHFGLPILFLAMYKFFPLYISFNSFTIVLIVNIVAALLISKRDDYNKGTDFKTITKILAAYFIFILSLYTVLNEMNSKNMLDDYSNTIYTTIYNETGVTSTFINTTTTSLYAVKSQSNLGNWELLTGIFLLLLKFIDVFFSIVSSVFNIGTMILLLLSIDNSLLLFIGKVLDFVILFIIIRLYFEDSK